MINKLNFLRVFSRYRPQSRVFKRSRPQISCFKKYSVQVPSGDILHTKVQRAINNLKNLKFAFMCMDGVGKSNFVFRYVFGFFLDLVEHVKNLF